MVFSLKEESPFTVRVDFFEDAVTSREKVGTVMEIISGDQIYQAYLDLVQATVRKFFEHINPDTSRPAVPSVRSRTRPPN
jgi:hypothetical protein